MNEQTVIDNATRCGMAYQRGYERGQADERHNVYNDSPLSGEWAGESIPELLGDLIDAAADEWERQWDPADGESMGARYFHALVQYAGDIETELCDHYEQGYMAAFADRSLCDVCNGLVTEAHAVRDNGVVYCSLSCSGDLG